MERRTQMAWPFLGSRRMTAMLRADGLTVNRKRVQRLMRLMGIAALARSRGRASRRRGTRSFRICCETWRSTGR
jgi:transposase InsO family protein